MAWAIVKNNRGRPAGADGRVTVSYRSAQRKGFVVAVNIPDAVLERLRWRSREDGRKVVVEQDGSSLRLRLQAPDQAEDVWALQIRKKGPHILAFPLEYLDHMKVAKPAEEVQFVLQEFGSEGALILTLPVWAHPPKDPEEEAFEMLTAGKAKGAKDLMDEFGWTQAKALEVVQAWRAKQ